MRSKLKRQRTLIALTLLLPAAWPALAQEVPPTRPLDVIIPFPPGGAIDAMARHLATALESRLKQRAVPLNREGGSTIVGMTALANAPADGNTILVGPVTALTVHTLRDRKLAFKKESFTPVCQTFENVFFVAGASNSPIPDFAGVLAQARARQGALRYGHPGVASSPHLAGAELWQKAGVQLTDIPYKGEPPMVQQFVSGDLELGIITWSLLASQKLKPFAVFADARLPEYPQVPTVAELGYAITPSTYGGVFMRAGTPAEAVARVEAACRDVVASAGYREAAMRLHQLPNFLPAAKFAERIDADHQSKRALLATLKLPE